MQTQNEKILYKTIPKTIIYTFFSILLLCGITLFLFHTSLEIQHILLMTLPLFFVFIRCFDSLTISHECIIFKVLFSTKSVHLQDFYHPPFLEINPYTLKKYEWQRKLLKQNFQTFWLNKSVISFPHSSEVADEKTLQNIRLSLFSKQQAQDIIAVLEQHWQLSPIIQEPSQHS